MKRPAPLLALAAATLLTGPAHATGHASAKVPPPTYAQMSLCEGPYPADDSIAHDEYLMYCGQPEMRPLPLCETNTISAPGTWMDGATQDTCYER